MRIKSVKFNLTFLFSIVLILFVLSCTKKKKEEDIQEEGQSNGFDRSAMLTNYADNIITPSLSDFNTSSSKLYTSVTAFCSNPTQATLDSAQASLLATGISWQYCSSFRYGPMLEQFGITDVDPRQDFINTFPCTTNNIETFVRNNFTNVNDIGTVAKGLSSIDYLLNDLSGRDSVIINNFKNSSNRKAYLQTITLDIKNRSNNAYVSWQSYRAEFIRNNGTSATSSTAELIKQLIVDFESLKNFEIGIPVGRILASQTLNPEPAKVQFYYSGYSLELASHHLTAIENLWYGISKNGRQGIGLKAYLESVSGGQEIVAATIIQFNSIKAKFNLIPNARLSDLIITNKAPVSDYYTEILKLTHYLKSDMPSRLSIYITYVSGDGD